MAKGLVASLIGLWLGRGADPYSKVFGQSVDGQG